MATPLRLLLVEDAEIDADLVLHELEKGGFELQYALVSAEHDVRDQLTRFQWDLVISDYSMPGFNGIQCLAILHELGLDIPFILVSGTVGEELAVDAMKTGAHDYMMKGRLHRLVPAIRRELREVSIRRDRKQFMEYLEFLAYHDPITRLPNHQYFIEEVDTQLRKCAHAGKAAVLVSIEIERFNEIRAITQPADLNALINRIIDRIRSHSRSPDSFARINDQSLALLYTSTQGLPHEEMGKTLTALFEEPFSLDPILIHIDVAIGIAAFPEHGEDAHQLLRNATIAANLARSKHRDYALYSSKDDRTSPENAALLGELRDAIRQDKLVLHYQPIIEIAGNGVTGVEALVRWNHPTRGLLPPGMFLEAAEHSNLIIPLTRWVANAASQQWKKWHGAGLNIYISINLSIRNIQNPGFISDLDTLLEDADINPRKMIFEITESGIMTDSEVALEVLKYIHSRGCGIAIDDFGAGQSSFAYLKVLPVDIIKIDRMFISNIVTDVHDAAIVTAILDFAKRMNKKVIAEGVETSGTLDVLRKLGCGFAQGYYISKPLDPEPMTQWLKGRPGANT